MKPRLELGTSRERERDIGAIPSLIKEGFPHQLFEQRLARRGLELPQAAGLRERQSQARHFAVFASDTRGERFKRHHMVQIQVPYESSLRRLSATRSSEDGWVAGHLFRRRMLKRQTSGPNAEKRCFRL